MNFLHNDVQSCELPKTHTVVSPKLPSAVNTFVYISDIFRSTA